VTRDGEELSMDRRQLEQWLAEEASGHDEAADAAFSQLFAAVPRVEPTPAFVEQAVTVALRWRTRRRRLIAVAWTTVVLLLTTGALTAYYASPRLAAAAIKAVTFTSSHVIPWLVAYTKVAMEWWWTIGRVGTVIVSAVVTPERAVAIVGVELVGILALFALLRVAGAGRLGDAQV
jgi:anti-sigma factor RsiW